MTMKNSLLLICGLAGGVLVPLAGAAEALQAKIERFDPALDALLAPEARVEKLAEGFQWAEGPVWYAGALVFSDVPKNTAYRWREGLTTAEVFLKPSGLLAPDADASAAFREPGSNGLAVDRAGRLLLCQGGERRVARWADGTFTAVADRFQGKHLNTPNDLAVRRSGEIYFTDPPYGFREVDESPLRELPWHGVYRVATDGTVTLLTKTIRYPNGLAFSPDERTLYVSSSDWGKTRILAFDVTADGALANERVFFDAQPLAKPDAPGACDGLKVDRDGNLWATGPGGVLVLDPAGKLLGRIVTGVPTGNCAWGDDGATLYLTANHFLLRVKTLTRGAGW